MVRDPSHVTPLVVEPSTTPGSNAEAALIWSLSPSAKFGRRTACARTFAAMYLRTLLDVALPTVRNASRTAARATSSQRRPAAGTPMIARRVGRSREEAKKRSIFPRTRCARTGSNATAASHTWRSRSMGLLHAHTRLKSRRARGSASHSRSSTYQCLAYNLVRMNAGCHPLVLMPPSCQWPFSQAAENAKTNLSFQRGLVPLMRPQPPFRTLALSLVCATCSWLPHRTVNIAKALTGIPDQCRYRNLWLCGRSPRNVFCKCSRYRATQPANLPDPAVRTSFALPMYHALDDLAASTYTTA
eukprot:11228323-Lingulodinium_polyedra.AAC.2